MRILQSASKLVFLLMGLTACLAFLSGLMESKDFMGLCMLAFSFYFSKKPSTDNPL